ncbi:hypothetical protein [Bacillus thuringiensis]|uniref:hypothetical protein n=1 Tax=Bacillus thuringiensis TaxID=1428 RepID=UPI001CCDE56A|nr:hypothetical protein [Bacillus thuringiensis]MBZ8121409.1 hypothetical protein [Bacillus thuringiensis]
MEVIYEHPWLTTWFILWICICASSSVSMAKKEKEPLKWNARNDLKTDGHVIYKCLICKNERKLKVHKKDYCEVKVCPNCRGVSVDIFKIDKYKQVGEKK